MTADTDLFSVLPPTVAPQSGVCVYAIGDIHGRFDLLSEMMQRIQRHAEALPSSIHTRRLVVLGDFIDRGPQTAQIIQQFLAPPPSGFERVVLRGNHEMMMLEALHDPDSDMCARWLANGGLEALQSYGIPSARGDWRQKLPREHRDFLESTLLYHQSGDFFFAHAGVDPEHPCFRQDHQALLWIRRPFLESQKAFGKIVVHGHSITSAPTVRPNRIGLDTGAYASHRLSCLAVYETNRQILTTDPSRWSGPSQ